MRVYDEHLRVQRKELLAKRKNYTPHGSETDSAWLTSSWMSNTSSIGELQARSSRFAVASPSSTELSNAPTHHTTLPVLSPLIDRPHTSSSSRTRPLTGSYSTPLRRYQHADLPRNLPMGIGKAYFGEEMASLRRRNMKLRTLAMSEKEAAVTAVAKVAHLEIQLQELTGSVPI